MFILVKTWKIVENLAVTGDCTRPRYGQYWADSQGNDVKFQNNLIALVVWAAMENEPIYFDFQTALYGGNEVPRTWQMVSPEEVKRIYRGQDLFGSHCSAMAQVLERLYKDALMNQ